jgi:hypothetical protein
MRDRIEAVVLEGQHLRVTARDPLGVEPRMLALAAAIRVFEQYPIVDRLTLTTGRTDVVVSRDEVLRLVGADGFAPLKDRDRFRQLLGRALAPADGEEGSPGPALVADGQGSAP